MINVDEFIEKMTTELDVVALGNMIIEIGESHKELERKLKIARDALVKFISEPLCKIRPEDSPQNEFIKYFLVVEALRQTRGDK